MILWQTDRDFLSLPRPVKILDPIYSIFRPSSTDFVWSTFPHTARNMLEYGIVFNPYSAWIRVNTGRIRILNTGHVWLVFGLLWIRVSVFSVFRIRETRMRIRKIRDPYSEYGKLVCAYGKYDDPYSEYGKPVFRIRETRMRIRKIWRPVFNTRILLVFRLNTGWIRRTRIQNTKNPYAHTGNTGIRIHSSPNTGLQISLFLLYTSLIPIKYVDPICERVRETLMRTLDHPYSNSARCRRTVCWLQK